MSAANGSQVPFSLELLLANSIHLSWDLPLSLHSELPIDKNQIVQAKSCILSPYHVPPHPPQVETPSMEQVLFHSGAARPQLRPHPYLNLPHVPLSSFPLPLPPFLLPELLNKSYAPESLSWAQSPGNLNDNSLGHYIKLLSSSHSMPDSSKSLIKRSSLHPQQPYKVGIVGIPSLR